MPTPNPSAPNRFSRAKLLHSKWTCTEVINKEKHFLVTELLMDDVSEKVTGVVLQAVINHNEYSLTPEVLKDAGRWQMGWK